MTPAPQVDDRPLTTGRPPFPTWLTAVIAIGMSLLWIGLTLLFSAVAPGGYRDFFQSSGHAFLRVTLPMALTGLVMLAILKATGRLTPAIWRDGDEVPPAPMWLRVVMILPIGVGVFGIVRRMLELGDRGLALTLSMLVAVIAVGATEELVFRGFVLCEERRRRHSEVKAVLVSMVLFGMWHLPNGFLGTPTPGLISQFFVTMIIGGVVLYGVRRVTRRLWPAIAAHALWDFAVVS